MKLAHENGMKVLLDGQGNDEIFAGYHAYFGFYFYELLREIRWVTLAKEMSRTSGDSGTRFRFRHWDICCCPRPAGFRPEAAVCGWMAPEFYQAHAGHSDADDRMRKAKDLNTALRESVLYSSIPHLLRLEDKNSMRWSMESRVPFLDYRLVEYVLSLAPDRKIRGE